MALAHYWFAFDIGAYEDSTAHLSMLQDGAYNRLIRHYYKTSRPIPLDEQQIVRISGAHSAEEIAAVSCVLNEFFDKKSDGWHNKRADEELLKAQKISKLRKELGRRGGLAKATANAKQELEQMGEQTRKQKATQLQLQKHKEESKPKAASAFAIPDWIPQEEWQAFEEMRRKIRKPMTDKARSLIVTSLYTLRSHGHSPKQVLEQSIRNGWQDVYELKGDLHGTNGQNHQTKPKPHVTAQHQRWASNVRAVAAGYGLSGTNAVDAVEGSAGVGDSDSADSPGQAARPGSRSPATVEGEVKRVL